MSKLKKKRAAQVVFLKGVNVGGHRTFRPSLLTTELARYKLVNIGAAGTFVLFNPPNETRLRSELLRRLPFTAEIMICSAGQIINLTRANPFAGHASSPSTVRFVSVLASCPYALPELPLSLPTKKNWLLKLVEVRGRFVFGLYRRSMQTISLLNQLEKHLGQTATTRNWNTIKSIAGILKDSELREG